MEVVALRPGWRVRSFEGQGRGKEGREGLGDEQGDVEGTLLLCVGAGVGLDANNDVVLAISFSVDYVSDLLHSYDG